MVNKLSDSSPEPSSTSHEIDPGNRRRHSAPDSPTKKQVSLEDRIAASKARLEESDSGDYSESSSGTSTPRNLSDSPKPLREREVTHLKEHVQLFHLSRALTESTKNSPLLPLKGEHATDVYMHDDVVFKPGFVAASRAQICYGLARLIGIRDVLVPAKRGKATIVHSQDQKAQYHKMVTAQGTPVLVNTKKATPLPESDFLNLVFKSNDFRVLSDAKQKSSYLAPHGHIIYSINAESKTAKIDDKVFKITPGPARNEYYLDPEPSTERQVYVRLYQSERDSDDLVAVLVPKNKATAVGDSIDENLNEFSFENEETAFQAQRSQNSDGKETWQIEIFPEESDDSSDADEVNDDLPKVWVHDATSKLYYNVPESSVSAIHSDDHGDFVIRDDLKFRPETDAKGKIKVTGTVAGMVQVKVTDIFTTPASSQKRPTPLNIVSPSPASSPAKAEFYDRIDTPSFIRAFIATILLRPQDGKVADLKESNVLFQAIPTGDDKVNPQDKEVKLRPILIDLDETMPRSNDYSRNPTYIKGDMANIKPEEIANYMEKHAAHAVRCGLMGFPQARKKLSDTEMEVARNLITEIANNRDHIRKYLFSFVRKSEQRGLTLEHISACLDMIDRMKKFSDHHPKNDWTLEDLFFTVFPEYKKHWDLLGNNYTFEEKASYVGYVSKTDLQKLHERRG